MNYCRNLTKINNSGQTIVEAVVAMAIITLLVTGLVIGTTVSLKSSSYARLRSKAVKYAQEGMEKVRNDRNTNWSTFQAKEGSAENEVIDSLFTRTVSYEWNADHMEVTVTVKWQEGDLERSSVLSSFFTNWR